MGRINFTKMVASGNDFVIISGLKPRGTALKSLARSVCDRKLGIGADGLLFLEKSKIADVKMRIFNADGSEAEMCGNGARCVGLFSAKKKNEVDIETKAGVIASNVHGDTVRIKLTDPKKIKLDIALRLNHRLLHVNHINTGVPHTVVFVEGLEALDVKNLGGGLRNHKKFSPRGTNVDFAQVLDKDAIALRTYERGVEDETLACGTGAVAAALIFSLKAAAGKEIKVRTKSGEVLKVYFDTENNGFKDVWLEGRARIVYKGVYNV